MKRHLALALLAYVSFSLTQAGAQTAPDWEKKWAAMVDAAKKEGKVVLMAPSDPEVRKAIPAGFKARYGIIVEYLGGRSTDMAGRLRSERQSGLYTVDVALTGTTTMAAIFYAEKMLDPLRPALIDPTVTDGSKWKTGKLVFIDPEEQFVLRMFNTRKPIFFLNTDYVKPEEIQTAHDLINPKYRGKIITDDPTVGGLGASDAARFYDQYGEDFIKKLYIDQKAVLGRERRQILDGLARGVYPIALGAENEEIGKLQRDGFPIYRGYTLKDMSDIVSPSEGHVAIFNNAPHPNAARLFANWIASKEGLEIYARSRGCSPSRTDIDEAAFLDPDMISKAGVEYADSYSWDYVMNTREKIRLRIKEILGR